MYTTKTISVVKSNRHFELLRFSRQGRPYSRRRLPPPATAASWRLLQSIRAFVTFRFRLIFLCRSPADYVCDQPGAPRSSVSNLAAKALPWQVIRADCEFGSLPRLIPAFGSAAIHGGGRSPEKLVARFNDFE